MMKDILHTDWRYDEFGWLLVDVLLITYVAGYSMAIDIALLFLLWQCLYLYSSGLRWHELKLQVRLAYSLLLVVGLYLPWHVVHLTQIVGTTALLLFNYCFLARTLLLMPWNRDQGMSWLLFKKIYFTAPVAGEVKI